MFEILTLLMPVISSVIGRVIPDSGQAAQATLELQKALMERQELVDKAIAEQAKAQAEVNLAEAQSGNLFVSGWRPAVGWICVAASGYIFVFQPTFSWVAGWFGGAALPVLDNSTLMTLLLGMLGIGGLRTYEKVQGVK